MGLKKNKQSSTKRKRTSFVLVFIVCVMGLVIIWVLSASRVGPVEACLENCTGGFPEDENQFVLINLNILHGFPDFKYLSERIELIAAEIIRLNPDFVTLQEVAWTWKTRSLAKYLAEKLEMNYVYLPANGNRWAILFSEGEAILSKYPLKNVEYKELNPKAGLFEHRVALKVTAIVPGGEINLISTHLTNGDPTINRKQTEDLYQMATSLGARPVMIAGDFNAREGSLQIDLLSKHWIDTYRHVNSSMLGNTCCVDELTGPDIDIELEKRIDFIFFIPGADPNLRILDSQLVFNHPYPIEADYLWTSDHIGIQTSFESSRDD